MKAIKLSTSTSVSRYFKELGKTGDLERIRGKTPGLDPALFGPRSIAAIAKPDKAAAPAAELSQMQVFPYEEHEEEAVVAGRADPSGRAE